MTPQIMRETAQLDLVHGNSHFYIINLLHPDIHVRIVFIL